MRRLFLGFGRLALAMWVAATHLGSPGLREAVFAGARQDMASFAPGTATLSLSLGETADGPPRRSFSHGTTTIYARVGYIDLLNHIVQVTIKDEAGFSLFKDTHTLSGSGSQVFALTGDMVFVSYFDSAQAAGVDLKTTLKTTMGLTRPTQIAEQVRLALGYVDTMQGAHRHIRRFPLTPAVDDPLSQALASLDQARASGQAALTAISAGRPLTEILGHVQAMDARADETIERTREARTAAGNPAGLTWLDTPETTPPRPGDSPACPSYNGSVAFVDAAGLPQPVDSVEWGVGDPGTPARLRDAPIVSPKIIYASSVTVPGAPHAANIEVVVVDNNCRTVADGTLVSFSLDDPALGTFSPITATTTTLPPGHPNQGLSGVAKTVFTASDQVGRGLAEVRIISGSLLATTSVALVGPAHRLNVLTERSYIYFRDSGIDVRADVRDANNRFVADGTPVGFTLQPASVGTFQPVTATVQNGISQTRLRLNTILGPALIKVQAGAASGSRAVVFVGLPMSLTVTAQPPVIRLDRPGSRVAELTVEVKDAASNPAPDGTPVTLLIADPSYATFLEGSPTDVPPYSSVTTDLRDGVVQVHLRAKGKLGKTLVLAQAGGAEGPNGSIEIEFRGYEIYLPALHR